MNDPESYWTPLCDLRARLKLWVRLAWREGDATEAWPWGGLLIIPVEGYLESGGGPIPIRDVEWVDVSTMRVKGGMAGRPLEFIDIKGEILAGLRETQLEWELRESTWTVERIFQDEPVQLLRFVNPFGPASVSRE
jgi:hypothetical protein